MGAAAVPRTDGFFTITKDAALTTLRYLCPEGILKCMNEHTGQIEETWRYDLNTKFERSRATAAVISSADVWSIGCVMAELLLRTPVFPPGSDSAQINKILEVVGTPSQEFIDRQDDTTRTFLTTGNRIPKRPGTFKEIFSPEKFTDTAEIDLLEAMLRFDPLERISIEEAITHSYFMGFASLCDDAPPRPFVPFEGDVSVDECRAKIWDEMCKFQKKS